MNNISIGLVHYPVLNKNGEEITTSITPFDIHDIARSAYTFGVDYFYIIHPSLKQKAVSERIINFWQKGFGKSYNQSRSLAFDIVKFAYSLSEAKELIENQYGKKAKIISTTARKIDSEKLISIEEASKISINEPVFILFGTGWGLTYNTLHSGNFILKSIEGVSDYNHLSVRAASAIILYLFSESRKNLKNKVY
jgi:hypothetical protein